MGCYRCMKLLFWIAAIATAGGLRAEIVLETAPTAQPPLPALPALPALPVVFLALPPLNTIVLPPSLLPPPMVNHANNGPAASGSVQQALRRSRAWQVTDPDDSSSGRVLLPAPYHPQAAPLPGGPDYNALRAARNVERAHALRLELYKPQPRK